MPVAAIHRAGDHWRIDLSSWAMAAIPALPANSAGYLADPRNLASLDRRYHVAYRPMHRRPATFSSMMLENVVGRRDTDIGSLTDALINLNQGEVFYLQIAPTAAPFSFDRGPRLETPAPDCVRIGASNIDLSVPWNGRLIDAPDASTFHDIRSSMTPLGRVYRLTIGGLHQPHSAMTEGMMPRT